MKMTSEEYVAHCDDDGICVDCGAIKEGGVEPDAECYPCDECGKDSVMGIENALLMGIITITA